jgi:hypothetical protein
VDCVRCVVIQCNQIRFLQKPSNVLHFLICRCTTCFGPKTIIRCLQIHSCMLYAYAMIRSVKWCAKQTWPVDNFAHLKRLCKLIRKLCLKDPSTVLHKGSTDASLLRAACSGKHACCVIRHSISTDMKRLRLYMHTFTSPAGIPATARRVPIQCNSKTGSVVKEKLFAWNSSFTFPFVPLYVQTRDHPGMPTGRLNPEWDVSL